MTTIRLKAEQSNKVYKAILTDDFQELSKSKANEAVDMLELDDEWSIYFENKEEEPYAGVEFVFKKEADQRTLTPDHVIYWDRDDLITADDFFQVLR